VRLPSAACAAIVEQARAAGWTPPGDGELMSAGEEAALVARALTEADAELAVQP
jgi:hypothetical protein